MIPKQTGATVKFLGDNSAFSFAVKNPTERCVRSAYFSRRESNLTPLSRARGTAVSKGGTCRAVHEKIPLVRNPRERNSRLYKADKTNNVFFERDI